MIIEIPFKTPSVNHLYGQHGNHRYIKPEAKKLRAEIVDICLLHSLELKDNILPLEVHVKVYENWYTISKTVKKKDIANREKFLIDSVFLGLGIDDKMIFKHVMEKIQSEEEKCTVEVTTYG